MIYRFILIGLVMLGLSPTALAFCGFYVGQADADLFNRASKVIYTRIGDTSTITMASDYDGPLDEFAMVVPVPRILEEEDVRTVTPDIIDHLDRYSAPRLVEYHDEDPCRPPMVMEPSMLRAMPAMMMEAGLNASARDLGVTIEREFVVDGYEIIILSAQQSDGLLNWLNANGYRTPSKALPVLADYIARGMKFFVAKISLTAQESAETLNPLQMSFRSKDFMLPIRLGMTNAIPGEDQELVAWFLSAQGRVEVENYDLVEIPSDIEIPDRVREDFGDFYQSTFDTTHRNTGSRKVFLEYGWDMGWCDPCAADPLSPQELVELGVPQGVQPYVSRLHMRYNAETHREDLALSLTSNRQNFQGRYIINNPYEFKPQAETFEEFSQRIDAQGPIEDYVEIDGKWVTHHRTLSEQEKRDQYLWEYGSGPESLMRPCALNYFKDLAKRRLEEERNLQRLTGRGRRSSAN